MSSSSTSSSAFECSPSDETPEDEAVDEMDGEDAVVKANACLFILSSVTSVSVTSVVVVAGIADIRVTG